MLTNSFFSKLLNLDSSWKIVGVVTDTSESNPRVTIEIAHIGGRCVCPTTGEECSIYDHAPMREWRHLDTLQYKTFLRCQVPRVINSEGSILTISVPWANKYDRHTLLFEHAVIDLLKATQNQTRTAELIRCSFSMVNNIIHRSVQRGLERRKLSKVEHLSIDEKSFRKGHNYITVLSHPTSGCVLDVEEGRTKKSTNQLINRVLTEKQRMDVKTITMDMWQAYIHEAKANLPNAAIVFDRFHLIKMLNKMIDQVRRREVKKHKELKHSRYALLKNEMNLTDKQFIKFEYITKANYEVSKAWQVKANFRDIFNESKRQQAFILFNRWVYSAYMKGIKEVTKLVDTFTDHATGIINCLVMSFSNAMAERLNGKIQMLKTVARGYRTFENFRSAILFFHGGLNLYPLKTL